MENRNYCRIYLTNGDNFDIDIPTSERLGDIYNEYLLNYHYYKHYSMDDVLTPEDAWEEDNPSYVIDRIEILPRCYGCRWDCPGQKDHMDIGGCLYMDSDD